MDLLDKEETLTYKDAGVDIGAGEALVKIIKESCPDVGGFGGLYPLGDSYLVAGTDGVGTKLKLAFAMDKHDTIGIDLVAMCVNDILTQGAKPLFFLDYFATSKLKVSQAEQVIQGILKGCEQAQCALLGGETAEMPDFYHNGEYDLSGFSVGIVAKEDLIDGSKIRRGDLLVGLPSTGFHSNGYSLIRKVLEVGKHDLFGRFEGSENTLGELLLEPTRIYVREIQKLLKEFTIKGMAHITGGGLTENIPRILPDGLGVQVDKQSWQVPSIFSWLQNNGNIGEEEMLRTFNMGIGMVCVLSPEDAKRVEYPVIGEVVEAKGVCWL